MPFELDFKTLKRLRTGGFADNAAMLSVAGGALLSNPLVASTFGMGVGAMGLAGAIFAGAGGAWIGKRLAKVSNLSMYKSELNINSDTPPVSATTDGMLLGYCMDNGAPLVVPWEDWMRHAFIIGQSGFGKTVMGSWVMLQQIVAGGGLIWIDGKLDYDNLADLRAMCAWAGREEDLLVVNPGNPTTSNTYNPILYGDADEVAARVLSLIPSAENNPGADHYRQAANQALTTLVGAIQRTGRAYNFIDLTILLQNQKALAWLESIVPIHSSERKALSIFLEQVKAVSRDGVVSIDLKKLRDMFGGVGGRMHQFGSGNFGMVTNSYAPDVNLHEAIRSNKIVYVMLPTMGKNEAASNFGKMVVGDFRTAISWVQALPKHERPWPPFLGFFDEAGSYVTPAWSRIFEQARSAHLSMLPAVQTMANFEAVSDELREMVIGNTLTKMFFKIGTSDTAEKAADLIGMEKQVAFTVSSSDSDGVSKTPKPTGGARSRSVGGGLGYTEREEENYKVTPDDLRKLDKGECVVTVGGSRVYHIKVPQVRIDGKFRDAIGPVKINSYRPKYVKGLDLFRDVDRWLSGND
ncbi:MAG: TraM recognition domain-containing protein [Anaerolineae bacterium]|nr:TraM recognition domain-containing protein [Anaerolineae bacterium]